MRHRSLLLSGAIILTAALTSTIAAVTYFRTQSSIERREVSEQPSQKADHPPSKSSTPSSGSNTPNPPGAPPVSPPPTSADFSHWRISLVDESTQSPEFAEFLGRLRQAVRDRDAQFVRNIVTPETKFDFGEHRSIHFLNPDNPDSPFWSQFEKTLALGCTNEGAFFSCPNTFRQFDGALKGAPENQKRSAYETSIIVVGKAVKVRAVPEPSAPVIAVLSDEIVRFDFETFEKASQEMRSTTFTPSNLNGWTPIILPNDKRGFVSTRYAYRPLSYRALFAKENGKWVLQAFVSGD